MLTLSAPHLLAACPDILNNVIFAAEFVYASPTDVDNPRVRKVISFVFSRTTLAEHYADVAGNLREAQQVIEKETNLIREDNLARGEIVRIVQVSGSQRDQMRVSVNTDALESQPSPSSPSEYWSSKPAGDSHFITNTTSYPWMPDDIAKESDVPF